MSDLHEATLLSTRIPGAPRVRIHSSVIELVTGKRLLNASMKLDADADGITTSITVPLDPATMRAMARVLNDHATRIGVELIPLLSQAQPDPEARAVAGQEYM